MQYSDILIRKYATFELPSQFPVGSVGQIAFPVIGHLWVLAHVYVFAVRMQENFYKDETIRASCGSVVSPTVKYVAVGKRLSEDEKHLSMRLSLRFRRFA
jgi:hypothetical protein